MSTPEERLAHDLATVTVERDKLRMLWESVDGSIKSVRAHQASKGGQHVSPPDWLGILKCPHVLHSIEWLCREALADTSPPAQRQCPDGNACERDCAPGVLCGRAIVNGQPAAQPAPSAGETARYLEDLEEPAEQPVALRPAREAALDIARVLGDDVHLPGGSLTKIAAAVETDRARRGPDPAMVEVEIQKMLADEKLSADVGAWTVNDTAQDGVLQAFVDYLTRSLLSQPRGSR